MAGDLKTGTPSPREKKLRPWPFLLPVLGLTLLACWWGQHPHLTAFELYHSLGSPLLRLLVYLAVGLALAQTVESRGWAHRLGAWLKPLLAWGRLKPESGASFTAAMISGLLANTMLWTFRQEGRLSQRELVLSYLFNNGLAVYLLHLTTTFVIIWPLVGEAGLIYLGLMLAAALLRSGLVLVYSRFRLPADTALGDLAPAISLSPRTSWPKEIWPKFRRRFSRLCLYTLPIYIVNDWGLFRWLRTAGAAWVSLGFLPVEAAGVVIFSLAAEFASGVAAAGALLQAGALTVKQTVLALVLGNLVATPIRALRHQLPTHMGIFSPKLGAELLLLSQGVRLLSVVVVTVPYGLWG